MAFCRTTYDHLFLMGLNTPVCHRNGPFALIISPTDEQPGLELKSALVVSTCK